MACSGFMVLCLYLIRCGATDFPASRLPTNDDEQRHCPDCAWSLYYLVLCASSVL